MSEENKYPGESNTGHIWDDNLRELTNQPPRWWRIGFHASWLFVVGYSILYPMWPSFTGHTEGVMGWTAIKEYKEDMAAIEAVRAPYEDKIKKMSAAAILADDKLSNYTVSSVKVIFGDFCAACHGAGGAGNQNFPVLADDDWLYGGTIDDIQQSIAGGQNGSMPAFGGDLSSQELTDIAKHVVALSKGGSHAAGEELFMSKGCFACHGMDGSGNTMMGAANLTDGIWRFTPGSVEEVAYTIKHGVNDANDPKTRSAEMPSFEGRLSDTEIKKLAVYVHKLGGGQ